MLFNSWAYALFFPLVVVVYYLLPGGRGQQRWLLAASVFFYAWHKPGYLFVLLGLVGLDYCAGRLIEASRTPRARRGWLLLSLGANLGVLAGFKYYQLFVESVTSLAELLGFHMTLPAVHWLLPLGLSFHTFQSLSYTMEVYFGRYPARRSVADVALYVFYFPQLLAGPIERPQLLVPQLLEPHQLDYDNVSNGLKRMAWGLFKKVVVADRLYQLVFVPLEADPRLSGLPLFMSLLLLNAQLYCDFSGYTDLALGAAQVLGVRMSENFNQPFAATSVADFWRRWHMSLTRWFRRYLLPWLAGSRPSARRLRWSLLAVFGLSGLWHGARWTFVAWGLLHGVYVVVGTLTADARARWAERLGLTRWPRLHHAQQVASTVALVSFAWLFGMTPRWDWVGFRLSHFWPDFTAHLGAVVRNAHFDRQRLLYLGLPLGQFAGVLAGILVVGVVERWQPLTQMPALLRGQPWALRWSCYYALILAIWFLGFYNSTPFVYIRY